ncbi:hypothetical protein L9F63_013266, partial [Diploptera punctata]
FSDTPPITVVMAKPHSKLWLVVGGVILCALVIIAIVLAVLLSNQDQGILPAHVLLSQVPLIDGHNDLAYNMKLILKNQINEFDFNCYLQHNPKWNCSSCMTDIKRLNDGQVGAQFWSAYVPCSTQYHNAVEETLEQIDVIKRFVHKYPKQLELVTTANGIWESFARKRIASLIGVEGGHSIDSRLAVLRQMYELGVRYLTLTHTCNTPWKSNLKAENNGLSNFGKAVVYEMNRLGMMVDLSHVSHKTMHDVLNITMAPVIFSHSSAYAICPHHRNVHDDRENGGIVMVNFFPEFVKFNSSKPVTIEDVAEHINYIRLVTGVDHVGIGGDYDGVDKAPVGLEDVSKYPKLFELLSTPQSGKPHWSTTDLKKLAGLNLLRVFKQVEKVRDSMSNQVPYENLLPEKPDSQYKSVPMWADCGAGNAY